MAAGDTAKRLRESVCPDLIAVGRQELERLLEEHWEDSRWKLRPGAIRCEAATPDSAWLTYDGRELYVFRSSRAQHAAHVRFVEEGLNHIKYVNEDRRLYFIIVDNKKADA
jgi:hypothetical protein